MKNTRTYDAALEAIFVPDAPPFAVTGFLNGINSRKDLNYVIPLLVSRGINQSNWADTFQWYGEQLDRWPKPRLSKGFKVRFPLMTRRLVKQQHIRALLAAAHERQVGLEVFAETFEEVLHRREVSKVNRIIFDKCNSSGGKNKTIRTLYHSQCWAQNIRGVIFRGDDPNVSWSSAGDRLSIDWRSLDQIEKTREEESAAWYANWLQERERRYRAYLATRCW